LLDAWQNSGAGAAYAFQKAKLATAEGMRPEMRMMYQGNADVPERLLWSEKGARCLVAYYLALTRNRRSFGRVEVTIDAPMTPGKPGAEL
jgi:hypothetical protein